MSVSFKFNLPDFRRQMQEVGAKVGSRVIGRSAYAAARVLRDEVRRNAPVLKEPRRHRVKGALRRAIFAQRSRKLSGKGVEHYEVKVRKGQFGKAKLDAFYWYFLERGWVPKGPNKRIRGGDRRKRAQRKSERESGASIRRIPFFQPAFDQASNSALSQFYATAEQQFKKEIK